MITLADFCLLLCSGGTQQRVRVGCALLPGTVALASVTGLHGMALTGLPICTTTGGDRSIVCCPRCHQPVLLLYGVVLEDEWQRERGEGGADGMGMNLWKAYCMR